MVGFVIPIVRKPFGKLILEIEDVLAIRKYLSEQDRNTCLKVNNSQPLVPRFQCFNHKFRREKGECESSLDNYDFGCNFDALFGRGEIGSG